MIELTTDEVKKLGITVKDKSIFIYSGGKANKPKVKSKPFYRGYNKSGLTITFNAESIDSLKLSTSFKMKFGSDEWSTVDYSGFENAPDTILELPSHVLVTDDLGQLWRTYKKEDQLTDEEMKYARKNNIKWETWDVLVNRIKESERKINANLSGYIPVLVRSGDVNLPDDKLKNLYRADIIIWYEPSEQLFNALPPRIADDLRREYQCIFVDKETKAPTCKYFEACKNSPGAISSYTVFPNPAEDELQVEFTLNQPRSINANLYTISGQLVKKIWNNEKEEKGLHTHSAHISELPPGIYLLVIETDKGDRISQRIIRK
ncbi:MAG: T9SS type A sorting domain-containing protein [Bacteroidia bacterium]|nr:T9SS type A sorting domain-containing protein [Bacteroidia bacterium]